MGPSPRHHLDEFVAAAAGEQPAAAGRLVRQSVQRGMRAARCASTVSSRFASGSIQCVSQPCWLTRMCGWKARSSGGTTASNARSQPASLVPAGGPR